MFHGYAEVNKLQNWTDIFLETLSEVKSWNKDNNLAFIKTKTKVFLFSFSRLQSTHLYHLDENELIESFFNCNKIERVKDYYWELCFDQRLKFDEVFTNVIKQCSSFIYSLRKVKRFAPNELRKQAESLVLSRLNYVNPLFCNVPEC